MPDARSARCLSRRVSALPMSEVKNPSKPATILWVFSLLLIVGGLARTRGLVQDGWISLGPLQGKEHYTGSLAVLVIAVQLGVGLFLLTYTIRSWRAYRKSLEHDHER